MTGEVPSAGGSPCAAVAMAAALVLAPFVFGALATPAAARDLGRRPCAIPTAMLGADLALPRVAERVRLGQPLKIVAIGSSSTAGAGASDRAHAYPARLQAALGRRFPGMTVQVVNKGVNGQKTPAMVARFGRDVLAEKPDLVIWQLGTNSIIQDKGVAGDDVPMRRGIALLKGADVDIILVDPQFAPRVTADPDYPDMLRIIAAVSRSEHVMLFPRFAAMRYWVTSGQTNLEAILSRDGLHMNDLGYGCLATLLADEIDFAVSGDLKNVSLARPPLP